MTSEYDSPRGPCHQRLTGLQARVENDHRQPVGHLFPHLGLQLDPEEEEGGGGGRSAPSKLVCGGGAHPGPWSPCPHPEGLDTLPWGGSSPRGRRDGAREGTCRMCPRLPGGAAGAQGTLPPSPLRTLLGATVFISRTPLPGASAQPGAPETWALLRETPTWRLGFSESPAGGRILPSPTHASPPARRPPSPGLQTSARSAWRPSAPRALLLPARPLTSPPHVVQQVGGMGLEGGAQPESTLRNGGSSMARPPAAWWPLRGSQTLSSNTLLLARGRPPPLCWVSALYAAAAVASSSGQCGAHSGPPREQRRPRRGGLPSDLRTGRSSVAREELELQGNPRPWEPRARGFGFATPLKILGYRNVALRFQRQLFGTSWRWKPLSRNLEVPRCKAAEQGCSG